MHSNALSLETRVDFRKYFSETSYLYVTPKIEQFVLNNGGDFIGSINGIQI